MYAKLYPELPTQKVAFVSFDPYKLPALQAKYGNRLELIGNVTLQPAAKGTATVLPFPALPGPKPKAVKKEKVQLPQTQAIPDKPRRKAQGGYFKPIVSITTHAYYASSKHFCDQTGASTAMVSAYLGGKKQRAGIRGHVLRVATSLEIEKKMYIPLIEQ